MTEQDNICQLHHTSQSIEEVLVAVDSIAKDLSQILVLGLGPKGELVLLTSHIDPALIVLMCERAKAQILRELM